jgi:hypothetical protein
VAEGAWLSYGADGTHRVISRTCCASIKRAGSLRLERLGIVPRFRRLPVEVQVGPNRFDKRCLSSTRADLCAISALGLYTTGRSPAALTGPYSASEVRSAGDLPPRQRAVFWHSMARHFSSPLFVDAERAAPRGSPRLAEPPLAPVSQDVIPPRGPPRSG